MNAVLLDTGFIVALLDRSERYHRRCVEAVSLMQGSLVTCESVIAESCYLLRSVRGAADAVLANVEEGVFQIPFQLTGALPAVRGLMKRYASVPMDLADACLVHLAGELGTGRIVTLDRDFEVYRWKRNRAFELIVELD